MKMRQNMIDVFNIFSKDEELLRLLYYKPINYNDNPLDPNKPNILDMPTEQMWNIIEDRIKRTSKVDDLDDSEKCRLLMWLGRRRADRGNYWVSSQVLNIDVLVSFAYEDVDMRLEWICDKVNELIFNNHVTGAGKAVFIDGNSITSPNGYIGYRLVYSFSSTN